MPTEIQGEKSMNYRVKARKLIDNFKSNQDFTDTYKVKPQLIYFRNSLTSWIKFKNVILVCNKKSQPLTIVQGKRNILQTAMRNNV